MGSVPSNIVSMLSPQIPVDQGIYEESTERKAMLGTKLEVGERVFRYAKAGAGCTEAGKIVVCPLNDASHVGTGVTPVAAAIGAQTITGTVATSAITTNQYQDGYIAFGFGDAKGQTYRIKSHTLGEASTGLVGVVFTLYDRLAAAITATSLASLQQNPYNAVLMANTGKAMGVTPIAVTSGNYFWLQTKGLGGVLAAAANTSVGALVLGTSGRAVAATITGGDTIVNIGQAVHGVGVAGIASPTFINLE